MAVHTASDDSHPSIPTPTNNDESHQPQPSLQNPSTSSSQPSSAPTPPKSTKIKNRRQIYLLLNPQYFHSPTLELSSPLLYDTLIRRFLTASEREAADRAKGWSGILEADLYRSEAKLEALCQEKNNNNGVYGLDFGFGEEEVKSKEEGLEKWKEEMGRRFVGGGDPDFEYGGVDGDEGFDFWERREEEERWFDEEGADEVGGTGVQDF